MRVPYRHFNAPYSDIVAKFGLGFICPECGEKVDWVINLTEGNGRKNLEVGQFVCRGCGAKSGVIEAEMKYHNVP